MDDIRFLDVHITSDLPWSTHTAELVKKAQQRLFNLRTGRSPQLLTDICRATTESAPCLRAAVWLRFTGEEVLTRGGENHH